MAKILAIANQKGGVGKTTTAQALIAGFSKKGYKILGIDLDPQGNLSDNCGAENNAAPTVYNLLKGEAEPKEAIQHIDIGGYDIIPSNIMLAGAEQELTQIGKEYRLKKAIEPIVDSYDYIIIDTPPSLGVLTVNAFTVADEIIIPTTSSIFATKGIHQLYNTVQDVREFCRSSVEIVGILMTKHNPRTNVGKQLKEITEQIGEHINIPVYNTFIRSAVAVEESQAMSTDIFTYSKTSTVAEDYKKFIVEYLKEEL